jgi:hypothetical protein
VSRTGSIRSVSTTLHLDGVEVCLPTMRHVYLATGRRTGDNFTPPADVSCGHGGDWHRQPRPRNRHPRRRRDRVPNPKGLGGGAGGGIRLTCRVSARSRKSWNAWAVAAHRLRVDSRTLAWPRLLNSHCRAPGRPSPTEKLPCRLRSGDVRWLARCTSTVVQGRGDRPDGSGGRLWAPLRCRWSVAALHPRNPAFRPGHLRRPSSSVGSARVPAFCRRQVV